MFTNDSDTGASIRVIAVEIQRTFFSLPHFTCRQRGPVLSNMSSMIPRVPEGTHAHELFGYMSVMADFSPADFFLFVSPHVMYIKDKIIRKDT
jgi:hypothetical protein